MYNDNEVCIKGDFEVDTKIISVDNIVDNDESYSQAVNTLRNGGVVAFPTETVYGLGALATNAEAVHKIFQAKGRPSDNPLIVHIGKQEEVAKYAVNIPATAQKLMDTFWPGPLTLVFERMPNIIAPNVTPGVSTIGIRMPNHPVALTLLRKLGEPLAAPSANRSGKPSPTMAEHVQQDLDGRIPLIVDGGVTGVGLESTVLDMTTEPPTILRPGGATQEMIEKVIGAVQVVEHHEADASEAPRSPGMKYTHYAPEAPLFVVELDQVKIEQMVKSLKEEHHEVAVIGPDELIVANADWYFSLGPSHDKAALAANLYKALRQCNDTSATIILAVETDLSGVGAAFMNRLERAADGKKLL